MHTEEIIPIKVLPISTPAYVVAPIPMPGPLPTVMVDLFSIEYGNDGSVYMKLPFSPDEVARNHSRSDAHGRINFEYNRHTVIQIDRARDHPYISFHSSAKINDPGRLQGCGDFDQMPFRIDDTLSEYSELCRHFITEPGMYRPTGETGEFDAVFDCFAEYPRVSRVPYFIVDIAPFNGDPLPILKVASRDTCVSYGFITEPVTPYRKKGITCQFFLRIKLAFGEGSEWPPGHQIVYKIASE